MIKKMTVDYVYKYYVNVILIKATSHYVPPKNGKEFCWRLICN